MADYVKIVDKGEVHPEYKRFLLRYTPHRESDFVYGDLNPNTDRIYQVLFTAGHEIEGLGLLHIIEDTLSNQVWIIGAVGVRSVTREELRESDL